MRAAIGFLLGVLAGLPLLLLLPDGAESGRSPRPPEPVAVTPDAVATAPAPAAVPESGVVEEEEEDADPVEVEPVLATKEAPPYEPAVGPCDLEVELIDCHTGRPVGPRCFARLWRFDVPEDEVWTEGDVVERQGTTGEDGVLRFTKLAAGRYRLQCSYLAAGAKDPAEFALSGERTRIRFEVEMPREFEAGLRVYDEDGSPITAGTIEKRICSSYSRSEGDPAWANPRDAKPPYYRSIRFVMGSG